MAETGHSAPSQSVRAHRCARRNGSTSTARRAQTVAILESYDRYGEDPVLILEYDQLVESVSSARLKGAAHLYLDTSQYVQGVLNPEMP